MAHGYVEGGPNVGNKMMGEFDETAEILSAAMEPFVEEQVREVDDKAGNILALVSNLKIAVSIISLLSIAVIIVSGMFLTRTITNPLDLAMNLAGALSNGDLTQMLHWTRMEIAHQTTILRNIKKTAGFSG